MAELPLVVIVGAGFGGLTLARRLAKAPVRVLLIDRNNYHLFSPLLYQVATAMLDPAEIAQPVRKLIRGQRNCDFLQAEVRDLDFSGRQVITDRGRVRWDYLVLATGSATNYFGNASLKERSYGLKQLPDGLSLRNRVLDRFERSRWEESVEARRTMLSFAIIGGGPTGVELAGALAELIHLVLRKDFRGLDVGETRVTLVEGGDRLLPAFHPSLSEAAARSLRRKRVDVRLGTLVEEVHPGEVVLQDGTSLAADTVVWTAGVRASELGERTGVELGRHGQVPVGPTLQLEGHPNVFVIGDAAGLDDLPMLIPVAMQQAKHVASALTRLVAGAAPGTFQFRDPGIMATVGRNSGIAQLGRIRLHGFPGWAMWLGVHLMNVVTFRARAVVLLNWAWDYLFYDRPIRIMVSAAPAAPEGDHGASAARAAGTTTSSM
jgi:NADH:ubiquinone reductase (H+-translocating)